MDERTVRAEGLAAPAEIAVDAGGLAHVRAGSEADLFFAQGWNAARDRLWQIDLWRKRGLGELAADFGPGYLAQDRASRLFLYRGDMAAEWACYAPDAEAICAAFAAGINAYIAGIEAGELPLPAEFELAGARPARWRAEDVVRIRSHAIVRNALSEVLRAKLLREAGPKADALRVKLEPEADPSASEEAPDLPLACLDAFRLATAGVAFPPERLSATLADAGRWSKVDPAGEVIQAPPDGSNNWAVAGSRTGTGRPLLALDPHRLHAIPSLRYMVHLTCPGFDALGAGEPGVPGISMGHNGAIAFGLTIFGADQEDVIVLDLHPEDPSRFRWRDGWDRIETVEETAEVRGCAPQAHRLEFCRHGPVVWRDPAGGRAVALRTIWSHPGSAAYMASLSVMRARNHGDYRAALRGWGAPSINHVYADVSGTIAWQGVGWTPVREGYSGLLPVPGDGSAEWAGFVDPDEMPVRVNPPEGFVASANAFNLPDDWAAAHDPIGHEWFEPSRHARIHAALADGVHGMAEAVALQNDVLALPAVRVQAVLRAAPPASAEAGRAMDLLLGWDGRMDAGSAGAALFELWMTRHLKPALFAEVAPAALHPLMMPGDTAAALDALERPERFFADPSRRAELLDATLAAAWADASARLGPDPAGWRWGDLHRLTFSHALSRPHPDAGLSLDPAPWPGSASTVMLGAPRPTDLGCIHGPSVRMVIDVGNWDACLWTNLPGQSGDPASPHYADFLETWGPEGYRTAPYSRAAVDAATRTLIRLLPA